MMGPEATHESWDDILDDEDELTLDHRGADGTTETELGDDPLEHLRGDDE
jgi:hypothetical protein